MKPCLGLEGPRLSAGPFRVAETVHHAGLELPRHAHEDICLHFVLDGVYEETIRGAGRRVARGGVLFKPAGEAHSNCFTKGARSLRIEMTPGARRDKPPLGPEVLVNAPLFGLGQRLLLEMRDPDDLSPMAIEGVCLEAIAGLVRACRRFRSEDREVVECATRLLQERFRESIQLCEVADLVGTHRSHLARGFRVVHRCTMGEYLRRLRVNEAMRLLRATRKPVVEIALATGFSDQSHLSRVFRQLVGTTPAHYRRICQR